MKLSIIVPVYKVERYIQRCILSIINQKEIDQSLYEIIIINDGTPDNSMQIIRSCSKYTNNIVILEQENSGVSEARNNGLKIAKGQYVWFVDSDDWISEDSINILSPYFDKSPDIIQIQYQSVWENDNKNISNISIKEYLYLETDNYGFVLKNFERKLPIPAQFMIYNREFLLNHNLFFKKGIYHEDCEFKPRALYFCRTFMSIPSSLYFYLKRETGSITSCYSLKHGHDMLQVIDSLNQFSYKNNINLSSYICMFFNTVLKNYENLNNSEKKLLEKEFYDRPYIINYLIGSDNQKYRAEGFFFKYLPKLAFIIVKLRNKMCI